MPDDTVAPQRVGEPLGIQPIGLRRVTCFDPRFARIDDLDRADVIHDPIDKHPGGTRRFHCDASPPIASGQQPRNPEIGGRPLLLPLSLARRTHRTDVKKRFMQIDPEIFWLHGRPPLTSGAMSFCHEHATPLDGGRPFHLITKDTKTGLKRFRVRRDFMIFRYS